MENISLVSYTTSIRRAPNLHIIPVLDTSRLVSIAEMILQSVYATQLVELRAEGPGGIHLAVRAIALARQNLECNGIDIVCTPAFIQADRTSVSFNIEPLRRQ
ncbi:MAG: stage V sporulation protein S [Anaerolineae bacterium]|nr:stage V sporulation protein S [Anaerolineae bacterium]